MIHLFTQYIATYDCFEQLIYFHVNCLNKNFHVIPFSIIRLYFIFFHIQYDFLTNHSFSYVIPFNMIHLFTHDSTYFHMILS